MSDGNKTRIATAAMLAGIGLGVLLCIVEFLNGRPNTPTETIFPWGYGITSWAERVFLILFGAIHLAVAAIITVFRRTAV